MTINIMIKDWQPRVIKAINDPIWWLATGLVLLLGSLLLAIPQTISPTEAAIFRSIYSWPGFLTPFFVAVSFLGSVWGVLAVLIYLIWQKRRQLAALSGLAATAAYLIAITLKVLVGRPRPTAILPNVASRELFTNTNLGFPSAHTAVSAALALILMSSLPKKYHWLALVWVILVAISRVYLGVHAPLDVVGGAGIGLICAGFIKFSQ